MKRLIPFLLAVIMLFVTGTALADDWYCPECGAKNSGNFCPNDGTKRPDSTGGGGYSASDLSIDNVKLENDGSVTVSWSGGTGPYKVMYEYYVNGDHNANADVILWTASENINDTRKNYETDFVPGEHYWIIVTDSQNHEAWYDYSESIGAFIRCECPFVFTLRTTRNNRSSKVDYFSARDIQNEFSYHLFGANIKITPKTRQDMSMVFRMAIKIPSGEPLLIHKENATIGPNPSGRYYWLWENFNFSYLWNTLMKTKGGIPSGTYSFKLFVDNEYLFTKDFTVN